MLITYQDIRNVRPIADNIIDEKRIAPYIEEAERLDVMPAIGTELYRQLDEDESAMSEYLRTLFRDGGYYDCYGKWFAGINATIAYLAYTRFVKNNSVNVTAFGVVSKSTNFSEPVEEKTLVRHANNAEKIGLEYLRQCVDFLKAHGLICNPKTSNRATKFKSIGN